MKDKKKKYSEKLLEELRKENISYYVYRGIDYTIDVSKIKTEFRVIKKREM